MSYLDYLTTKYFIEQKCKEISILLLGITIFCFIAFGLIPEIGKYGCNGKFLTSDSLCSIGGIAAYGISGLLIILFIFLSGLVLGLVGFLLWVWIQDNFCRARERAEEDIKMLNKTKRIKK